MTRSRSHRLRRGALGLALALTAGAASPASADTTPKIWTRVTDNDEVIAVVRIDAPLETVRKALISAEKAHSYAPTTLAARATTDGTCERIALRVKGLFSPFVATTRRCPTSDGWLEKLVESDDFSDYLAEWKLQSMGDATAVHYRVRTIINVSVPQSMITSQTRKVLKTTLQRLIAAVDAAS
ncbi:MAG: hypothetical protein R3B09_00870 [Nannocystaceae bacterium]